MNLQEILIPTKAKASPALTVTASAAVRPETAPASGQSFSQSLKFAQLGASRNEALVPPTHAEIRQQALSVPASDSKVKASADLAPAPSVRSPLSGDAPSLGKAIVHDGSTTEIGPSTQDGQSEVLDATETFVAVGDADVVPGAIQWLVGMASATLDQLPEVPEAFINEVPLPPASLIDVLGGGAANGIVQTTARALDQEVVAANQAGGPAAFRTDVPSTSAMPLIHSDAPSMMRNQGLDSTGFATVPAVSLAAQAVEAVSDGLAPSVSTIRVLQLAGGLELQVAYGTTSQDFRSHESEPEADVPVSLLQQDSFGFRRPKLGLDAIVFDGIGQTVAAEPTDGPDIAPPAVAQSAPAALPQDLAIILAVETDQSSYLRDRAVSDVASDSSVNVAEMTSAIQRRSTFVEGVEGQGPLSANEIADGKPSSLPLDRQSVESASARVELAASASVSHAAGISVRNDAVVPETPLPTGRSAEMNLGRASEDAAIPEELPTDAHRTTPTQVVAGRELQSPGRTGLGGPDASAPAARLEADAQRLVDRVSSAIQKTSHNGGQLRIRLHPPELGTVQIEVVLHRGQLSARLEVHTTAAHQALTEQLTHLREALAQTGAPVERIDIHLAENRHQPWNSDSQTHSQQAFEDNQSKRRQDDVPDADDESAEQSAASSANVTTIDAIDVQV